MVRLINNDNIDFFTNFVYKILCYKASVTDFLEINNKELKPCIYALWHANQLCLHAIKDKAHLNILISNSFDGEIIARIVEKMGFKTVRGSSNRKGCVSATLQLIDRLKQGECAAIMVDGPQGPLHKVKRGVIKLAKETGAPIVPVSWYTSSSFFSLPTWDRFKFPLFNCKMLNLYGEPIYVSKDDDMQTVVAKVEQALLDLDKRLPLEFKKAKKEKLWNQKH